MADHQNGTFWLLPTAGPGKRCHGDPLSACRCLPRPSSRCRAEGPRADPGGRPCSLPGGGGVSVVRDAGGETRREAARRLARGGEARGVSSFERVDGGGLQGCACRLRHEQGDDPFPLRRRPAGEARQAPRCHTDWGNQAGGQEGEQEGDEAGEKSARQGPRKDNGCEAAGGEEGGHQAAGGEACQWEAGRCQGGHAVPETALCLTDSVRCGACLLRRWGGAGPVSLVPLDRLEYV